jgi:hypothetical protein
MGPSGSGKSTLLHILGILDLPSKGSYELEGHDITQLSDDELSRIRNTHFGFVFQSFNLLPEFSALENVMMPLTYAGVPAKKRKDRAVELLERLGLGDRCTTIPTCSRAPAAESAMGEAPRRSVPHPRRRATGTFFRKGARDPRDAQGPERRRRHIVIVTYPLKDGARIILGNRRLVSRTGRSSATR